MVNLWEMVHTVIVLAMGYALSVLDLCILIFNTFVLEQQRLQVFEEGDGIRSEMILQMGRCFSSSPMKERLKITRIDRNPTREK